jgi:hypothetical protein
LMTEAIRSSETPVHTRATRRHIPEEGSLQNNLNYNGGHGSLQTVPSSEHLVSSFYGTLSSKRLNRPDYTALLL